MSNPYFISGPGSITSPLFFSIRKSLADEIEHTKNKLSEHFHDIFIYLKFFQEKLKENRGKAVSVLQTRITGHFELLNQYVPAALYFLDTTQSALHTLNAANHGEGTIHKPQERQKWMYSLSSENTIDISISTFSLKSEAKRLQNVLTSIEETLKEFISLFDSVINSTNIPWGKFSSLWNEGKTICQTITEEMKIQVEHLITDTETLVSEMERVDYYIAFGNRA